MAEGRVKSLTLIYKRNSLSRRLTFLVYPKSWSVLSKHVDLI